MFEQYKDDELEEKLKVSFDASMMREYTQRDIAKSHKHMSDEDIINSVMRSWVRNNSYKLLVELYRRRLERKGIKELPTEYEYVAEEVKLRDNIDDLKKAASEELSEEFPDKAKIDLLYEDIFKSQIELKKLEEGNITDYLLCKKFDDIINHPYRKDWEGIHKEIDDLIIATLKENGYVKSVERIESIINNFYYS
jgi:hypothetical protein